jgi:hypothetical protein
MYTLHLLLYRRWGVDNGTNTDKKEVLWIPTLLAPILGKQYQTWEIPKVVCAEFSTLSWTVLIQRNLSGWHWCERFWSCKLDPRFVFLAEFCQWPTLSVSALNIIFGDWMSLIQQSVNLPLIKFYWFNFNLQYLNSKFFFQYISLGWNSLNGWN